MKAGKTIWALLNNGLEFLLGFGIIAIITRFFPQEETGKWFIFMGIFSILGNMRDAFVQTALVKGSVGVEEATELESLKANLTTTFSLELIFSSIMFTLGLLKVTGIHEWLLLYPLYAIPNALFRWSIFYLRSRIETSKIFRLSAINLFILGSLITFILIYGYSLNYLIAGWGIANFLTLIFSFKYVPFTRIISTKWKSQHLKLIGRYGLFATLRELTSTLSTRMGVFLSGSMLGLSHTALLGTGQRYSQIINIPNNSLQGLLFPVLVKDVNTQSKEKAGKTLEVNLARILALVFAVGLVIILFSYPIVRVLHGVSYLSAIPLLITYVAISSFFTPFGTAFGSYVTAIGKPEISSRIVFIDSVINILLTWVMIKYIGLYGAPLSLLLTEIIGFIMVGNIMNKEGNISFKRILRMVPGEMKQGADHIYSMFLRRKPAIS